MPEGCCKLIAVRKRKTGSRNSVCFPFFFSRASALESLPDSGGASGLVTGAVFKTVGRIREDAPVGFDSHTPPPTRKYFASPVSSTPRRTQAASSFEASYLTIRQGIQPRMNTRQSRFSSETGDRVSIRDSFRFTAAEPGA